MKEETALPSLDIFVGDRLVTLLKILKEESNTVQRMELNLHNQFQKHEIFKVGCTLVYLLQGGMLSTLQRTTAYILLCCFHRNETKTGLSPFTSFVLDCLEYTSDFREKLLLMQLLSSPLPLSKTTKDVLYSLEAASPHNHQDTAVASLIDTIRSKLKANTNGKGVTSLSGSSANSWGGLSSVGVFVSLPLVSDVDSAHPNANAATKPVKGSKGAKDSVACSKEADLIRAFENDILKDQWSPQEQYTGAAAAPVTRKPASVLTSSASSLQLIKPSFVRLLPPSFEDDDMDEIVLLSPDMTAITSERRMSSEAPTAHTPTKNAAVTTDTDVEAKHVMLMKDLLMAFTVCLTPTQQQSVINELKQPRSASLIESIDFTPKRFSLMIEKNPIVAAQCFVSFVDALEAGSGDTGVNGSDSVTTAAKYVKNPLSGNTDGGAESSNKRQHPLPPLYLACLVHVDMSLLKTIEVVNYLIAPSNRSFLPKDFIHLFISNGISVCENSKNLYLQSRLVRLVSVFVQSLLRNKVIHVRDVYIEAQAFCIQFFRVKEAAALFGILKAKEEQETLSLHSAAVSTPSTSAHPAVLTSPES